MSGTDDEGDVVMGTASPAPQPPPATAAAAAAVLFSMQQQQQQQTAAAAQHTPIVQHPQQQHPQMLPPQLTAAAFGAARPMQAAVPLQQAQSTVVDLGESADDVQMSRMPAADGDDGAGASDAQSMLMGQMGDRDIDMQHGAASPDAGTTGTVVAGRAPSDGASASIRADVSRTAGSPSASSSRNGSSDDSDAGDDDVNRTPQVQPTRRREDAPLMKLSVSLISTYTSVNNKYYAEKAKKPNNDGRDNEQSDYKVQIDEILNGRYHVERILGAGSFGQVVRAQDRQTERAVAIKIIKSRRAFHEQAKIELKVLHLLNSHDSRDQFNIVRLEDHFMHYNHDCLVFELLSYNLYELLRNTRFHGVSLNLCRKFAQQILIALAFLRQERVIHCDLKPENILLRDPRRSAVKLIDFGSSCQTPRFEYIQSRFYRAPEVLLGMNYSYEIDMWSLGCILVELHVGEPLFPGKDQVDQLHRIVSVLGPVPQELAQQGNKHSLYFDVVHSHDSPASMLVMKRPVHRIVPRTLEHILGYVNGLPRLRNADYDTIDMYPEFIDLVSKMLRYEPRERISPAEALRHPFFTDSRLQPRTAGSAAPATGAASPAGSVVAPLAVPPMQPMQPMVQHPFMPPPQHQMQPPPQQPPMPMAPSHPHGTPSDAQSITSSIFPSSPAVSSQAGSQSRVSDVTMGNGGDL